MNPAVLHLPDLVMGYPDKKCIVASGVAEFHGKVVAVAADIIALNLLELVDQLGGNRVSSVDYDPQRFEMVLVTIDQAWFGEPTKEIELEKKCCGILLR